MSDIKETFDESEYDYDKITGGEEGGMSISSDLIRGHINTIILRIYTTATNTDMIF